MDFEKAAKAVRNLIEGAYELHPVPTCMRTLKWNGPKLHESLAHVSKQFEERLTKEGIEANVRQNRDILDIAIGIALQVGVGQGIEYAEGIYKPQLEIIQSLQRALKCTNKTAEPSLKS